VMACRRGSPMSGVPAGGSGDECAWCPPSLSLWDDSACPMSSQNSRGVPEAASSPICRAHTLAVSDHKNKSHWGGCFLFRTVHIHMPGTTCNVMHTQGHAWAFQLGAALNTHPHANRRPALVTPAGFFGFVDGAAIRVSVGGVRVSDIHV
jgi:hypothetical protein